MAASGDESSSKDNGSDAVSDVGSDLFGPDLFEEVVANTPATIDDSSMKPPSSPRPGSPNPAGQGSTFSKCMFAMMCVWFVGWLVGSFLSFFLSLFVCLFACLIV